MRSDELLIEKVRPGLTELRRLTDLGALDCLAGDVPVADLRELLHELEIYQVELELQNSQLSRTQHELEAVRDKYFQLFHLAPVSYLTLDAVGSVVEANLTAVVQFGVARNMLTGKPLSVYVPPEDHLAFHRHRARVLESQRREHCELRFRRRGNELFHGYVESVALPPGPHGERLLLSAILDISASKRTEHWLRQSEARYRSLFEGSRDAIVVCDSSSGALVEANAAASALFGAPVSALRGRTRSTLFPPAEAPAIEAALQRAANAPERSPVVEATVLRGADSVPVEIRASSLAAPGQAQPLELTVLRDTTERRRLAAEREALEARLQQSQRLEAIGRLAGGVAHDMNNVLGAIMVLASLLPEELAQIEAGDLSRLSGVRQNIDEILAASRRGRDLTQNLLGFARKGATRVETLSMNALVEEVAALLRRTAAKQVTIQVAPAPEDPSVEGDPTQLHQVLMNLCLNALDAMADAGCLRLTTRVLHLGGAVAPPYPHLAPGRYATVSVQDDGQGMSPEVLARAFEPFFTTKPLGQGTGLGLAMVYGTVRNHNGAVTLDSTPGEGTTATIYLPLSSAPVRRTPSGEIRLLGQVPGMVPKLVLLVDDEQMIRSAGRRLLVRLGFDVVVAESGPEALRLYEQRRAEVALVLLDLSMPGMDGVETLRRLLAIEARVKVLLCSGFSAERVPRDLLQSASIGFLRKPFELSDLTQQLRALRCLD